VAKKGIPNVKNKMTQPEVIAAAPETKRERKRVKHATAQPFASAPLPEEVNMKQLEQDYVVKAKEYLVAREGNTEELKLRELEHDLTKRKDTIGKVRANELWQQTVAEYNAKAEQALKSALKNVAVVRPTAIVPPPSPPPAPVELKQEVPPPVQPSRRDNRDLMLDIIAILERIDRRLDRMDERVSRFEDREVKFVRDELRSFLAKDALNPPNFKPLSEPPPASQQLYTDNGVSAGSKVYLVYVDSNVLSESRIYEGKVTALTAEEVSVYVEEDDTEEDFPADQVFLRNPQGLVAAKERLEEVLHGELAVKTNTAKVLLQLLTNEVTVELLESIPHRSRMRALALLKITNFNLKSLKGEERLEAIVQRITAFKADQAQVRKVMDSALELIKSYEEYTANDAVPTEAQERDFVVDGKEWYRVVQVKRGVIFTEHNKNGMKRAFKNVVFAGRTKLKKRALWNPAPKK
jgi:hypothetical protein